MSITTRASKFIKKQTEKIFNQDGVNITDDIIGEVDLIENDYSKVDNKSSTSIVRLNDINAKDLLDKKLREMRSSKRDKAINNRIDEIERRLYGIGNDIEADEQGIIRNSDAIELLSHRTVACETRIRVVEDRVQQLENDFKITNEINDKMDKLLKKESYDYLYLNVKNNLKFKLQKRNESTTKRCLISLSLLISSVLFTWVNTEVSLLISSLFLLLTVLIGITFILKGAPKWYKLLRLKHVSATYDAAILEYLKDDLELYISLKDKKTEMDACNELVDFNEFINMEKLSIKKKAINVVVTLIGIVVFFVFLNRIIYINTSYNFLEILLLPFTILSKVLLV